MTVVVIQPPAGGGGGGSGSGVTVMGTSSINLGATQTINFANKAQTIWLVGLVNANLAVTITNTVAGCQAVLLLTQTGSFTLTVNGTAIPQVAITPAGQLAQVNVDFPDAVTAAVTVNIGVTNAPIATPWLGLNGNSTAGYGSLTFWTGLGLSWDRQEIVQPAAAPLSAITTALGNGMTGIVFVIETSTYNTGAAFPTLSATINAYAAYFVATVQAIEAAHPGIGLYEIINESWLFYSGGQATTTTYAAVVLAVLQACQTAGLDLTRIYPMVKDQSWPAAMITAQPSLSSLIKGWSIHPYGAPPPGNAQSTTQGIGSVPYFRTQCAVGQDNIIISEIGVWDYSISATNAASEPTALDGTTAKKWARQILAFASELHEEGWLRVMTWYSRNDTGWATNAAGGALTNVGTALSQFPLDSEPDVISGYSASDDGWVAVNMDPYIASGAVQLSAAGKVHLYKVRFSSRQFVQAITVYLDTAGGTLTASQCLVGIYDAVGNLLVSTATTNGSIQLATAWVGSTGRIQIAFTGSNLKSGYQYVAIGANGSVMPKFRGVLVGDQANMGSGGVLPTRAMVTTASFTTSLPSTIDLVGGVSRLSSGILVAVHA